MGIDLSKICDIMSITNKERGKIMPTFEKAKIRTEKEKARKEKNKNRKKWWIIKFDKYEFGF